MLAIDTYILMKSSLFPVLHTLLNEVFYHRPVPKIRPHASAGVAIFPLCNT